MTVLARIRRMASPTVDPERLRRPALAPDVVVHEPLAPDGQWFIQRGGRRYFAVAPDLARLAAALNGERDHEALARELGPPWRVADVARAVTTLAESSLLDDGTKWHRRGDWITFVPPLTLQVKVLNPARLLAKLAPVIRLLGRRATLLSAAAVAVLGLVSLAWSIDAVGQALGRPLPPAAYLAIVLASFVTTALHEVAHGAVLTFHGGRPHRMGVMLFYLTPAFFCDVSDGWRLPRKEQRVQVALAGIATQFVVAGAAALVAGLIDNSSVRDTAFVFAVVTYIAGLLNLVPFVKFDGYIALMCHLNVSHLRKRAIVDARRLLARALFGGVYERALPQHRWAALFGIACMLFPVYLVGQALALWGDVVARMGLIGTAILVVGLGYLGYHLVRGIIRLVREGRAAKARWWRIGVGLCALAAGVVALFVFVKVPHRMPAGYVTTADGRVDLVLPVGTDAHLREGAPVTLLQAGLVTASEVGAGVVGSAEPTQGTAPLSALVPVLSDAPVPVNRFPLVVTRLPAERVGVAEVHGGTVSLGTWLYLTYVAPALPE